MKVKSVFMISYDNYNAFVELCSDTAYRYHRKSFPLPLYLYSHVDDYPRKIRVTPNEYFPPKFI